ncbi:NADP-dependent oxidoreductase [Streptomyces ochraceiscleroticus]|uniref:NADP-dependent oxidoreductase n=1 Tax=Streptomyces ochraceiscleroticus TaxID=47761 RepID=A0ABW1MTT4_9ACTN|nr:NADP-dependent oxidoreductase [Streptomyces ochraceiscleroticus]
MTSAPSGGTTMRAITQDTLGGPDVLRMSEVARPQPLPTEVLVRVHAAGVNPIDWKTRQSGGLGVVGDPPFTVGWDVSGVVEEVGFGVHTLAVGDEVYGMPWFPREAGAYAEYVTAPSRQFARKPALLNHEHAAAVPLAALTAWQTLVDAAQVTAGQRVLIHAAAGGVGHFAVQLAKHLGAHVIGTASAAKHDWLRRLGADELVDYTAVRFEDEIRDVDVVIDLVGDEKDDTSTRSLGTLRSGGLLIAVPSGVAPELADTARQLGLQACGFLVEPDGTALTKIAELIDKGVVKVEVEDVLPLEHAAEAHRRGEQARTSGKLVLKVRD